MADIIQEITDTIRGRIHCVKYIHFWDALHDIKTHALPYVRIEDHPMLGAILTTQEDKQVTIQEVAMQYDKGHYITMLYIDNTGSHGVLYYGNISSQSLPIIKAINRDQRFYGAQLFSIGE